MRLAAALLLPLALHAQPSAPSGQPAAPLSSGVSGTVFHAITRQPLRRAVVSLRPQQGGPARAMLTEQDGRFRFPDVPAGVYALDARRDGYLPTQAFRAGTTRLPAPFALNTGQQVNDLTVHLQPAGVLAGKVRFDDAEAASGVLVQAFREFHYRGRHGYQLTSAVRTNDRGEYRLPDLTPGSYVVAAYYQSPTRAEGVIEQPRLGADNQPLPAEPYVTTFYPETPRFTEAVMVPLAPGQEVGSLDVSLATSRLSTVRGRVLNGATGREMTGVPLLYRVDAEGTGLLATNLQARPGRDGGFEVPGVVPGRYLLIVRASEDGKSLYGRRQLTVGEDASDNLSLVAYPERAWSGTVRVIDGDAASLAGMQVVLEPRTEGLAQARAVMGSDGTFRVTTLVDEAYDLVLLNMPFGHHLAAASAAGTDVLASGLNAPAGDVTLPLALTLSRASGSVSGTVTATGGAGVPGAALLAVPEPWRGQLNDIRETSTNDQGRFQLTGLTPGRYRLMAWAEDPPCSPYEPEGDQSCSGLGEVVDASANNQKEVTLRVQ